MILYRITLAPLPDVPGGPPPLVRLRKALKALRRAYRLRCERVEELEPSGARSSPEAAP